MKEVVKTVYVSEDGKEYETEGEAALADQAAVWNEAIQNCDKHWDMVSTAEIVEQLNLMGYIITKKPFANPA